MSYSEQLCGCINDMYSCLIGLHLWIPGQCVLHSIATNQITNKGFGKSCLYSLTCCFGMATNRQEIKRKLHINEAYWEDCCIYLWCMGCAATQDFREAENIYLANP